jgi:catechol 2,3-dioxygenase-like lactoylglutathione lyase family enzyme
MAVGDTAAGIGHHDGMAVQLNHTIVHASDKHASAAFLADVLGLPEPVEFGPFMVVEAANGVSLDFATYDEGVPLVEHYAFLVTEDEFDEIFGRINERGLTYYPGPSLQRPMEINHHDGGRGCYFLDPDGHVLEIITRPYGSG